MINLALTNTGNGPNFTYRFVSGRLNDGIYRCDNPLEISDHNVFVGDYHPDPEIASCSKALD